MISAGHYSAAYSSEAEALLAFAKAMHARAQLEPSRDKFILEAFQRGRGSEWRLDDEAIRSIVLPLLHEFFQRPEHSSAELQHHYEQTVRRRNNDRLPKSLMDAVDFLLKQNDSERLDQFLKGRPHSEKQKIIAYIRWKTSS